MQHKGQKDQRASSSTAERRRHKRFIEEVRVRYRDIEGVEASRWGRSRDLSLGGMCLLGTESMPEGTHIALEVHIENELAPVLALGRVVRVDVDPDEQGYAIGVEFLWISEEDRSNLQRLAGYFRSKYGETGDLEA